MMIHTKYLNSHSKWTVMVKILPENIQYTMNNCDLSTKAIVFLVIFFVKIGKRHDVLILHDT